MSRQIRLTLIVCLMVLGDLYLSQPASACALRPATTVGTDQEVAAWRKAAPQRHKAAALIRRQQFQERIRNGWSAEGLAALLIPNVREWYEDESDCGPRSDGDGPAMADHFLIMDAFKGSQFEGVKGELLQEAMSATFKRALRHFKERCNIEFRGQFEQELRARVPRRELDRVVVWLSEGGERETRLFRFDDEERATLPKPASPMVDPGAIESSTYRRSLVHKILESFWQDATPELGSAVGTCPHAYSQLLGARATEIEWLRRRLAGRR